MKTRAPLAALAASCLVALGPAYSAAGEGPGTSQRGGLYVGIGAMGSGNYRRDMTNFQSYAGNDVKGGGSWTNISLALAARVWAGLYVVPELVWSVSTIKTTMSGFEAAPNERTVSLLQYGAGLRYYLFQPSFAAFFAQGGARAISGMSEVDGFPVKSKGLATELKVGAEATMPSLRVGLELGYAAVPVKPPVDPAYAAQFHTPTTALGGNYGGVFGGLTCSFWW